MDVNIGIFSLQGLRVLVTGSSRGIGFALARGMAAFGADVILSGRSDITAALETVRAEGHRAEGVVADLGEAMGREKLWLELERLGMVPDVLVNNAGIIRRAAFPRMSFNDWQTVIDTNLTAVFDLSQRFARACIQSGRHGKIINIHSLLSHQGGIQVASYTAAKSGLLGLTRAMANDLAPHGIQVNGISPGYIATDNTLPLREDPERAAAILGRIPAGRWGEPEDLVGAAVFLASRASDYVSGTDVVVDGGWLAR